MQTLMELVEKWSLDALNHLHPEKSKSVDHCVDELDVWVSVIDDILGLPLGCRSGSQGGRISPTRLSALECHKRGD